MFLKNAGSSLPKEVVESAELRGITLLTPPQELALKKGLMSGSNIVVAAPTASGKTFIAEMAMLRTVLWDKKKALYIAPMRALVSEKYSDMKKDYPYLHIAMSIGDLDALDHWLDNYDVIFVSTEKLDSLIRHGVPWLDSVGCVVVDELHMLGEYGRGPTLEVLITKLRKLIPRSQIISLSATIGNAKELADWLDAELLSSDFRPVPLEKGVVVNDFINFGDHEEVLSGSAEMPEVRIAQDTLHKKKQVLFFYSTKRNAEAGAERLAEEVSKSLTPEEKAALEEAGVEVLSALGKPTSQCEKLARFVKCGVAFHHAGLANQQRGVVEDYFKRGIIKTVCSTTTLGFGVNMPAHTVVVRDTIRYSEGAGSVHLGVNEVMQLFGRAGRPKYDKYGRALLISKNAEDAKNLFRRYITADLEPIYSQLGVMPVLRTHVLSFIATDFLSMEDSITAFLLQSFYGHQHGSEGELHRIINSILEELEEWGFIHHTNGTYKATRIGSRVSELYIDPVSAKWIIDTLPKVSDDISCLFMITNTMEMKPYSKATEEAEERFIKYGSLLEGQGAYDSYLYDPIKPFSTALMLNEWISEKGEQELLVKYHETPGSIFTKTNNADWMLYSSTELARLVRVNTNKLLELRVRMRYGIKKELLDLVRLEQVGRVRARTMFNSGIKTVEDLRKQGSSIKLERLFGKEVSAKILSQLGSV
jgi:helicase